MDNLTLVIMAAGMGSRFGGLKQIEPVGPSGEIIADYSVYDAIRAGFSKVIFIIRREHLDYFKEHITSKFEDQIKVEFAFQELDMIPSDVSLPEGRVKMLGTGHALFCAKDLIDGNFVLINSDDFYGLNSYQKAAEFFKNNHEDLEYLTVNYPFYVTETKNGAVKRGVVFTDDENFVTNNIECEIERDNGKLIANAIFEDKTFELDENHPVTVNFFGLRPSFLEFLESEFAKFIHGDIGLKDEFLLPEILRRGIKENKFKMLATTSESKWMGVTYKEDLPDLKKNIEDLIKKGEYPNELWDTRRSKSTRS